MYRSSFSSEIHVKQTILSEVRITTPLGVVSYMEEATHPNKEGVVCVPNTELRN